MALELEIRPEATRAENVLLRLKSKLKAIETNKMAVELDAKQAERDLKRLKVAAEKLNAKANVDSSKIDEARQKTNQLETQMRGLEKKKEISVDATSLKKANEETKRTQSSLGKLQKPVHFQASGLNTITRDVGIVAAGVAGLRSSVNSLGVALGALGGAAGLMAVADTLTNINNKLLVITDTQQSFNNAMRESREIALATRSGLQETTQLYARITAATAALGASQQQVARVTETVSKALQVGGASTQEAASVMLQLGQALGSGQLMGQELTAILENSIPLSKALADGFGVTVGQLKKLGEEGKLTSRGVFDAILRGGDKIDSQFSRINATYGQAMVNWGNAFLIFSDAFQKVTGFSGFATMLNDGAIAFAKFGEKLQFEVYKVESRLLKLGAYLAKAYSSALSYVQGATVGFVDIDLSGIIRQPKIELMDWFPSLEEAEKTVMGVITRLERGFFWLYDEVIGHSWIPDLVEGTQAWLDKLSGKPLVKTLAFTAAIGGAFMALAKLNPFGSALAMAGSVILMFTKVSAVVGASVAGIAALKGVTFEEMKESLIELLASMKKSVSGFFKSPFDINISDTWSKTLSTLKGYFDALAERLDNTYFVQGIRQILGMRATAPLPYKIGGRDAVLDTNSKVGKGPLRNSENRPILHDALNVLPEGWHLPLMAGLTLALSGAVLAVFSAGTFRNVLLSVMTTLMGLLTVNIIHDSTLANAGKAIGTTFLDVVQKGMKIFFGEGLIGDKGPLSALAVIAKTMLLFEGGRKFLGNAALGVATAPTQLAMSASAGLEKSILDSKVKSSLAEIGKITTDTNNRLSRANQVLADAQAKARALGVSSNAATIAAQENLRIAQESVKELPKTLEPLTKNVEAMKAASSSLGDQLRATAEAAKQGVTKGAANIGGIFGSMAGFNFGMDVANKNGWSDGAKIFSAVAGVLIGQAIGSAIGATMVTVAFQFGSIVAATLMSKFVIVPALIGAAIYAAFSWDTLRPIFEKGGEMLGQVMSELWDLGRTWAYDFSEVIGRAIPFLKMNGDIRKQISIEKEIDELNREIKDALEKRDGLSTGAEKDAARAVIAENTVAIEALRRDLVAAGGSSSYGTVGFFNESLESQHDRMREFDKPFSEKLLPLLTTTSEKLRAAGDSLANLPDRISRDFHELVAIIKKEAFTSPVKRASGGWVSGPGGATDDKIPAMLSNGEFVVNAAAAQRNRALLHAINSGTVAGFADGGEVGAAISRVSVKHGVNELMLRALIKVESNFNPNAISQAGAAGIAQLMPSLAKELGLLVAPSALLWEKAAKERAAKDAITFAEAAKIVKPPSLETLQKENDMRLNPEIALNAMAKHLAAIEKRLGGNDDRVIAAYNAGEGAVMRWMRAHNPDVDRFDFKSMKFDTSMISQASGYKETRNYVPKVRESMGKSAPVAEKAANGFSEKLESAFKVFSRTMDPFMEKLKEMFGISTGTKSAETLSGKVNDSESLAAARTLIENNEEFKKLGYTTETLTDLKYQELKAVAEYIDVLSGLSKAQPSIKTEGAREEIEDKLKKSLRPKRGFMDAVNRATTDGEILSLINAKLSEIGLKEVPVAAIESVEELRDLLEATKNLSEAQEAPLQNWFTKQLFKKSSEELSRQVTAFSERIVSSAGNGARVISGSAQKVGTAFGSEMTEGLSSGLKSVMRGETGLFKGKGEMPSLFTSMLDKFTAKMMDNAIDAMTSSFMDASGMEKGLSNFMALSVDNAERIGKMFGGGGEPLPVLEKKRLIAAEDVGGSVAAKIVEGAEKAASNPSIFTKLGEAMEGIFKFIGSLFSGDTFSSLIGGAKRMLGFASGGYVSGPGSSTSDSIPAMLSNGEFVVNAAATKKFLPLLQRINGGAVGAFAEGGQVGTGVAGTIGTSFTSMSILPSAVGNLAAGVGQMANSVTYVGDSMSNIGDMGNALSNYGRTSSAVLREGFGTIENGLFGMGSMVSQGLSAFGVAMMAGSKPGKFNWFGAALSIAGAALGAFGGSSASFKYSLKPQALGSGTSFGTGLKLATGGFVSGPGTGVSDSIAAMLSNGEFVVNAAATSKFLPLLEAINSGSVPAFAAGGYVGAVNTTSSNTNLANNAVEPSVVTQVFNINVTGDVSRQTRKEIINMLPDITSGVNARNKEAGVM